LNINKVTYPCLFNRNSCTRGIEAPGILVVGLAEPKQWVYIYIENTLVVESRSVIDSKFNHICENDEVFAYSISFIVGFY